MEEAARIARQRETARVVRPVEVKVEFFLFI